MPNHLLAWARPSDSFLINSASLPVKLKKLFRCHFQDLVGKIVISVLFFLWVSLSVCQTFFLPTPTCSCSKRRQFIHCKLPNEDTHVEWKYCFWSVATEHWSLLQPCGWAGKWILIQVGLEMTATRADKNLAHEIIHVFFPFGVK